MSRFPAIPRRWVGNAASREGAKFGHLLDAARELFNREGFVDVSIDQIMGHAGLTRGGFYNHFETKEDLFLEVIEDFGRCNPASRWEGVELDFTAAPATLARQMVDAYLSRQHLEDLGSQCPLMALPSDAAQTSPRLRAAYSRGIEQMAGLFEAGVAARNGHSKRERSLALVALCIGGMVVAQTTNDASLATEVREAARSLAAELVTPQN